MEDLTCYETFLEWEDRASLLLQTAHSLTCQPRHLLEMTKRQKVSKEPVVEQEDVTTRLTSNVDAMGCIIQAVHRELRKEMAEREEEAGYLHRRIQELDRQVTLFRERYEFIANYACELEGRLDTMEALVSNVVSLGRPECDSLEDAANVLRATREYDMTDVDRIFADMETEDEAEVDFDELFSTLDEWIAEM